MSHFGPAALEAGTVEMFVLMALSVLVLVGIGAFWLGRRHRH
jgi:hypothetical protein